MLVVCSLARFSGIDHLANMHRPRHPHHHCPVSSFELPGRQQEEEVEEQEEEEQENVSCYAACLTEDLQLFGQLNDLQQVQAGDDVHLLQLTTEVSRFPLSSEITVYFIPSLSLPLSFLLTDRPPRRRHLPRRSP